MKKLRKYNLISLLLLIYTLVLAIFGWHQFEGKPAEFFGILSANIVVIVLLRFVLKRREKFREEMKKRDNALAQKAAEEKENGNDSAGN
ncbi:MAG TPA: hypothetical protein IAD09_08715 [Candidatus Caccoplasma merdavium]|nr:hypothetical protein [Candidatus Caccoplasma merdavium]